MPGIIKSCHPIDDMTTQIKSPILERGNPTLFLFKESPIRSISRPFVRVVMTLIVLALSWGALASPVAAQALPGIIPLPIQPGFSDLFSQWIALIACLVNVCKMSGWIKDGQAITLRIPSSRVSRLKQKTLKVSENL
jgi:hypothetical protein